MQNSDPLNCHQNLLTTRTTCNFKYHSSKGIRYYNEINLRTYALTPKSTHVSIYKYSIMTCSDYKLKLYPVQIIACVSIQIQNKHNQSYRDSSFQTILSESILRSCSPSSGEIPSQLRSSNASSTHNLHTGSHASSDIQVFFNPLA